MREVDLLSNIQAYQRNVGETVSVFVNRFKGTVAMNVSQTTELNDFFNQQFSIFMLRNVKLSPHTINTVTFQLVTTATSRKKSDTNIHLSLDRDEVVAIIKSLNDDVDGAVDSASRRALTKVVSEKDNVQEYTHSMFNMEATSQSHSQVKCDESHEGFHTVQTSMLGKRAYNTRAPRVKLDRITKMNAEIKCRACGEPRHWFRDRLECT